MGQIYLVRHGQTDWNKTERFRGQADIGLNYQGIRQAHNLAEYLSGREIAAVYSSPLKRALKTAEIIAVPHGLVVQVEPGFLDVDYGEWQGLTLEQISRKFPTLYQQWLEDPRKVDFPRGDSIPSVGQRVLAAFRRLAEKHGQETIAIIAHQAINKILLFELFKLKPRLWEIPQDIAAVNIITYDGNEFRLQVLNDTAHLQRI